MVSVGGECWKDCVFWKRNEVVLVKNPGLEATGMGL